jgi:hypothetical protein
MRVLTPAAGAPQIHLDPLSRLPEPIRTRLAAEGVTTLQQWYALGRRRYQIFGVTHAMVAKLDDLARAFTP